MINNGDNSLFQNIPYKLNEIFTQICYYKCYEVNLKRALLMDNIQNLQNVCLINAYWFEQWKNISCYEEIKDELSMNANITENFKLNYQNYNRIVQKINNHEKLDIEINNKYIFGEYDEMLNRYGVDEEAEFELISCELWNSFNTKNNNEKIMQIQLEHLSNDSLIVQLNNNSCYIIFWERNEHKIGKIILTFNDIIEKNDFMSYVKDIGFGTYYEIYLKDKHNTDITDKKNITYKCINLDKRKLLPYEEYKKSISFPVGLKNIRQTCYMNAALQSLFNSPKLSNYLINNEIQIKQNGCSSLLSAYLKIVLNLSRKAKGSKIKSSYSPNEFHSIIINEDQFKDGAGDSIDLVRFFLENMNRQLHSINPGEQSIFFKYFINLNTNNNNNMSIQQEAINLNNFISSYGSQNNSIISNTFYYIEKSRTKCCNCNYIIYNFNCQMEIVFPLEEVRKFVNNKEIIKCNQMFNNNCNQNCNNQNFNNQNFNNQNFNNQMFNNQMFNNQMFNNQNFNNQMYNNQMMFNNQMFNNQMFNNQMINNMQMQMVYQNMINSIQNRNSITLNDCFDYYRNKTTNFTGANQMNCHYCKILADAFQANNFYTLPDILIINLNRGKGNMYNVKITFTEELNLNNDVETKIDNNYYKLICVVTHLGSSGPQGHYIAFCYVKNYNKWFKFNDDIVSESSYKEASTLGDTYILFYERQQQNQINN